MNHTRNSAIRYASAAMPKVANGLRFDRRNFRDRGDVFEQERRWEFQKHPGTVRVLEYLNHADAGTYSASIKLAQATGTVPARPPNQSPLRQNDRPREHAERDQQEENNFGDRTGLQDEIYDFAANEQQKDGRKMHCFLGKAPAAIMTSTQRTRRRYRIRQCNDLHAAIYGLGIIACASLEYALSSPCAFTSVTT